MSVQVKSNEHTVSMLNDSKIEKTKDDYIRAILNIKKIFTTKYLNKFILHLILKVPRKTMLEFLK
jgi:hypothetical protein